MSPLNPVPRRAPARAVAVVAGALLAGAPLAVPWVPRVHAAPTGASASTKASAGPSGSASGGTKASASASAKPSGAPTAGTEKSIQPDPTPLVADAVFVLSIRFDKGKVSIVKVVREKLPKKAAVPRKLGRFAVELLSGPTVVERVRFDFPLIHDDDVAGEAYAKGLDVTVDVRVPDSDRPNKLEIWDRATDKRWKYTYPPKVP